jgi:hypothetical protein
MENKKPSSRRSFLKGVAASPVLLAGPAPLVAEPSSTARDIGPSTTTEPYLLPSITGARTKSILTVGDSVEGYRMVGIPDGLGAFRTGHREFTLLMNHEITAGAPGIVRAHGSNGAFVSRWAIDSETLRVYKGRDLTPSPAKVFLWDPSAANTSRVRPSGNGSAPRTFRTRALSTIAAWARASASTWEGRKSRRAAPGRGWSPAPTPARPGSSRAWAGWPSRTPWPLPIPRRRRSWS